MNEAVDSQLSNAGPHILPLSGGFDSRIILGSLLERLPAKSILTYTYGVPGSDDYEIGNLVAARAGTTHFAVSLEQPRAWNRTDLEEIARLTDANNSLFHPAVWLRVFELLGRDGTWWTGYTGDGIGGSFTERLGAIAHTDPVAAFLRHELSLQPDWPHKSSEGELRTLCVDRSPLDNVVSSVESVWFANHVERYTTHHIYLRGLRFASPFMSAPVVQFFCSLERDRRVGKNFFNEWARRRWPALFSLPTKDYGWELTGRPRRQFLWRASRAIRRIGHRVAPQRVVHPHTSYWRFDADLRHEPLLSFVRELLMEVHDSGVWDRAEWEPLWRRHQRGERLATVLLNGASLGIVQGLVSAGRLR